MDSHHLITDDDMSKQCSYCGLDLSKMEWKSEFFGQNHYKTTKCSCGKNVTLKVVYSGSGHDDFNKDKNLETRLKEFRTGKKFLS